jgi:hypothetical protein
MQYLQGATKHSFIVNVTFRSLGGLNPQDMKHTRQTVTITTPATRYSVPSSASSPAMGAVCNCRDSTCMLASCQLLIGSHIKHVGMRQCRADFMMAVVVVCRRGQYVWVTLRSVNQSISQSVSASCTVMKRCIDLDR